MTVPSPFRVLLLEDDRLAQEIIRRQLAKGAVDLHLRCVDTEEAFEAAVREPGLHVILSDFTMPSYDALSALRLARRLQPRVPFIVVTGSIDEETAAECIKAGAADYVLKDRIQRLWPAVRAALDKCRVQEERERALQALEESEQRYAIAVHGANDGIWDWDLRQRRAYFSARWKSLVGAAPDALRPDPREWLERIHPEDQPAFRDALERHLSGEDAHFECEHRVRQPDGSYLWVLGRGSALRDASGEAYRIAGSLTDISRRKGAEAQLIHDALHDSLTGLANRALFLDRLRMAMARGLRRGEHDFAVFFVDLDQFKVVNDSLGHRVGDELLVLLAHRLSSSLRPGDTVARLGGDEFAVLVDDVASPADAIGVARRALEGFGPSFHPLGHELFSTASIGIVLGARSYSRPEEYLRDADTAMYRAKARGRGQFEIFDSSMHALASSTPGARDRHPARARPRRVPRVLPAARGPRGRPRGGLRGARPLGAPAARLAHAADVHRRRRGDGRHRADRRVRAARGVPDARSLAPPVPRPGRPQHERQPLGAAVHAGRHDGDRERRAARRRRAGGQPAPRDHGERAHGRPARRDRAPRAACAAWACTSTSTTSEPAIPRSACSPASRSTRSRSTAPS